ncbi:MAG: hypothetical protein H6R00_741 [Proteobacteria bacterium]|nr:hypothetical protein [Pseudomonadota bacterium]
MGDVFTPETLAERWRCLPRHVRNMIASGDRAAFRLGDKLLPIRGEVVEEFERRADASEDSRSPSTKKEGEDAIRSELIIRARLTTLRQRYSQR